LDCSRDPLAPVVPPGSLEVEIFAAPATLPALRLGEGDKVALGVDFPKAAAGAEVIEEGTNTLLALAHRVLTERDERFSPPRFQRASQPLAMDRQAELRVLELSHAVILRQAIAACTRTAP
jgi:hypothetical protein